MTTHHKSNRDAHEKVEVPNNIVPWFTKNVERMAELEKKSLEMAAEQNTEWVEACKKALSTAPETPGTFLFDLIGQSVDRFVETQKGIIDLVVEQSHSVANLAQERSGSASKAAEGVTALYQQTVEHSVAAQHKALDYIAEQQKATYTTLKKQLRVSSTPATDAFQMGIDTLIETQRAVLDFASKPLKRAATA
jgi:hypothetical protein